MSGDHDKNVLEATARLLVAAVVHHSAVASSMELAVKSGDIDTIRKVRRALDLMTNSLKNIDGRPPPTLMRRHRGES